MSSPDEQLRAAAEALARSVRGAFPSADHILPGWSVSPTPIFFVDVTATRELVTTDLVDLSRELRATIDGSRFELVSVSAPSPSGSRPQRIVGVTHKDPPSLRRLVALHDRALERSHLGVARSLRLFESRSLGDGDIAWRERGTTLLRVLEDTVRSFLRAEGFLEVRGSHTNPHSFYLDERRGASALPLRVFEIRDEPVEVAADAEIDLRSCSPRRRDRAHVFLRDDQVEDEGTAWLERVERFYSGLGIPGELRDEGDARRFDLHGLWDFAEHDGATMRAHVSIDLENALRSHTRRGEEIATEHFDVTLTAGIESLLAAVLEQTVGRLPLWLAPVQVLVVPISRRARPHAECVHRALLARGVRSDVDRREDGWENKVRQPVNEKVPCFLVLGNREAEDGSVDVRTLDSPRFTESLPLEEFVERVARDARPPF
jgi:threonyl-tRNA synthetase